MQRIAPLTALATIMMLQAPAFAQTAATPETTTPPAATDTMPAPDATTPDATMPDATAPSVDPVAPADPAAPAEVTEAPSTFTVPEGYSAVADLAGLTSEQLTGATIYGPDGSSIGEVSDVVLGDTGAASGLIVDVGGFLGMGTHTVNLGVEDLTFYSDESGTVIAASTHTEDALKAMPEYTPPT